jgi:hypothetical protein
VPGDGCIVVDQDASQSQFRELPKRGVDIDPLVTLPQEIELAFAEIELAFAINRDSLRNRLLLDNY